MRALSRLEKRLDALTGAEQVLKFDVRTGVPRHDPGGVVQGLKAAGWWFWQASVVGHFE